MYIMRRMAHVAGLAGIDHAAKATKVVQDAGVPASLWVGGVGAVPGTVAWSVIVDSFAQWAEYTERLAADTAYNSIATEGREFIDSFEPDELMQVVHEQLSLQLNQRHHVVQQRSHSRPTIGGVCFAVGVSLSLFLGYHVRFTHHPKASPAVRPTVIMAIGCSRAKRSISDSFNVSAHEDFSSVWSGRSVAAGADVTNGCTRLIIVFFLV